MATVRPIMPEAQDDRDADGQQPAVGVGKLASGRPSRRPISRPMRSPTTAATNSSVDMSATAAGMPVRRLDGDVRQDRVAHHGPGREPRRQQQVALRRASEEPVEVPSDARQRRSPGSRPGAPPSRRTNRSMRARRLADGPVADYPSPEVPCCGRDRACPSASRERPARDHLEAPDATRPRTHDPVDRVAGGHDRPRGNPGAPPRAAVGRGPGTGAARPAARPRRRPPCAGRPAGRATTRRGPARAAGRAPARPRWRRRRG